jgi:hypothetical protein
MRINKPLKIHKWMPVATAMSRMLAELYSQPELGLLHHESWFSRTTIQVQYWRSIEHLLAYSKSTDSEHLPAWRAFHKSIGFGGDVGIWHETYLLSSSKYECVYGNMPAFGLGKAGILQKAQGKRENAAGRLQIAR